MHIINSKSDLTPKDRTRSGHVGITKGRYGAPPAKSTGGRVREVYSGIKEHTLNSSYPL